MTRDFQQCGILTRVDSDKPVQHFLKLRNSKWCSVSSLTLIEYSSDKQRLWSDCAYAQADLRLCWLHIPHCWKSHALAQFLYLRVQGGEKESEPASSARLCSCCVYVNARSEGSDEMLFNNTCMLLRCSHMQLVRLFKYGSDHHCKLISLYACA